MTPRTQRRAVERKARKAEEKKQRNLAKATLLKAPIQPTGTPSLDADPELQSAPAISEAQLIANRTNAQLSRGPVTPEGKSVSARNNFRHGLTQTEAHPILLDCESKTEYAQLLAAFEAEWQPATPTELDLVHRLVNHSWLRRRALNLQQRFLSPHDGLIIDEKQFNLYRRYEVQHERAFNKALSDVMRLRSLRIREQNGFESQRRKNEKHEYQLRHLKHRELLQQYAQATAEARLTGAQNKLLALNLPKSAQPVPLKEALPQQR